MFIETNSLSILNILETLKSAKLKTKLIQASSSEILLLIMNSNNKYLLCFQELFMEHLRFFLIL